MKRGRNVARKGMRSEELMNASPDYAMRPSFKKNVEDTLSESMDSMPKTAAPSKSLRPKPRPADMGSEGGSMMKRPKLRPEEASTQKFSNGGDVRYNPNRGKTY